MSNTPHELAADFPEFVDQMQALKATDAHFVKLSEAYHVVNREVHRAETNVEPVAQMAEAELRKKRAQLKDELYAYLRSVA